MNCQDFYEYIEEHRARVVEALQAKYESITSYLKRIEELLEGRASGSSEAMSGYYHYWERRIFNAITTMLLKGKLRGLSAPTGRDALKCFYILVGQCRAIT